MDEDNTYKCPLCGAQMGESSINLACCGCGLIFPFKNFFTKKKALGFFNRHSHVEGGLNENNRNK